MGWNGDPDSNSLATPSPHQMSGQGHRWVPPGSSEERNKATRGSKHVGKTEPSLEAHTGLHCALSWALNKPLNPPDVSQPSSHLQRPGPQTPRSSVSLCLWPPWGLRVFLSPTDGSQDTPPMPGRGRAGQGGRGTLGLHGLTLGGGPSSGCPLPASQPPVCGLPESREHCTVACSAPELTGWGASLRSAQGPHKVRTQGPPPWMGQSSEMGVRPSPLHTPGGAPWTRPSPSPATFLQAWALPQKKPSKAASSPLQKSKQQNQ